MNNRSILIPFLALMAIAVISYGQATRNLAGELNTVVLDGTANMVNINPVSSASMTRIATTTMTVVTSIADRHTLRIDSLETDETKFTFVSVGVANATASYGIPVWPGHPLVMELGEDVPVALISTAAHVITVTQTSRP